MLVKVTLGSKLFGSHAIRMWSVKKLFKRRQLAAALIGRPRKGKEEEEEEEEEERFVLKAYKSYSKPSWGGTFIRLPARFILCLQHVASMLPYGGSMFPACCQHVTSMLTACCHYETSELPACCHLVARILPGCCQHVASMLPTCCQHVASILLA